MFNIWGILLSITDLFLILIDECTLLYEVWRFLVRALNKINELLSLFVSKISMSNIPWHLKRKKSDVWEISNLYGRGDYKSRYI